MVTKVWGPLAIFSAITFQRSFPHYSFLQRWWVAEVEAVYPARVFAAREDLLQCIFVTIGLLHDFEKRQGNVRGLR